MAGEELNENTKESQDAAEALRQSERNKQTREKIGNDPDRLEERLGIVDRDKYDLSGFSDKEINMALQGGTFDQNDYERLTGATTPVNEPEGGNDDPVVEVPDTNPIKPPSSPPPSQTPVRPYPPIGGGSTHTQIVNQDNDINSDVSGDNNNVNIGQDNSVNQYGGYTSDMNASNKRAALGATNLMDNYVLSLRKAKTTI